MMSLEDGVIAGIIGLKMEIRSQLPMNCNHL